MPIEIIVPRLGWSMEEGVFREWLVEAGAVVRQGNALFVLETDKAAQEVESFDDGILGVPENAPNEGDKVVVGQVLGYLLQKGEVMPELPCGHTIETPSVSPPVKPEPSPAVRIERQRSVTGRIPVTPRARRRAHEMGVDIATVSIHGTGRGGRIRECDILNSDRTLQSNGTRTITFMNARALTSTFDAMVADIARQKAGEFTRRDLIERLLKVALHEHPELNAGGVIEIGATFCLTDFTGRRIETWVPEIAVPAVAALGIGRATGDPLAFPLNLSFDATRVSIEEAADFLDRLCELIETPVLALVR